MNTISIITFNILAHVFSSPAWYPEGININLLDREMRLASTSKFIKGMMLVTSIFCLQEVNKTEYNKLVEILGSDFYSHIVYHDKTYWSEWIIGPREYEPHGNALFIKKSEFKNVEFNGLSLLTGNYSATCSCVHIQSRKKIRLINVHFNTSLVDQNDCNDAGRYTEINALLNQIPDPDERTVDLIVGDMNCNPSDTFWKQGFSNALISIGQIGHTYPSTPSSADFNMIDHIMCRNATPFYGHIFDFGIMNETDETVRIEECLKICGSDHFPVKAMINL